VADEIKSAGILNVQTLAVDGIIRI